jgi:hypothetical protein
MRLLKRLLPALLLTMAPVVNASAAEPSAAEGVSSSLSPTLSYTYPRETYRPQIRPLGKLDYALYGSVVAYRTLDYFSTSKCAHDPLCHEKELPRPVIETDAGLAAFEAGMAGIEIGTSVWLHRHGHHRLARTIDVLSVTSGGATVALSSIYGEAP